MISAPGGSGLSDGFLEDASHEPLPFLAKLQAEEVGEAVGHVETDGLIPANESHDAGSGDAGFPLQGVVGHAACDDGVAERVGYRGLEGDERSLCELSREGTQKASSFKVSGMKQSY